MTVYVPASDIAVGVFVGLVWFYVGKWMLGWFIRLATLGRWP